MDYMKKIEDSIKFVWANKQLWWFGFILALFGSGAGSGGNGFGFPTNNSEKFDKISDKTDSFLHSQVLILVIFFVTCLSLIIALAAWYLTNVSKAALMQSVKLDKEGKKMTFKKGWKFGKTKVWKLIILDLYSWALGILAALVIVPIIILGVIIPPFLCLICLLAPFLLIISIIWSITYAGAQRYIVLKGMKPRDSIKAGWYLAKRAFTEYVISFFVSLLPGCMWALILAPLTIVAAAVVIVILLIAVLANPFIGVMMFVVFFILYVVFSAALNSPYVVFTNTYWTKIVMELMDKYEKK